jgi:hypothetical protein
MDAITLPKLVDYKPGTPDYDIRLDDALGLLSTHLKDRVDEHVQNVREYVEGEMRSTGLDHNVIAEMKPLSMVDGVSIIRAVFFDYQAKDDSKQARRSADYLVSSVVDQVNSMQTGFRRSIIPVQECLEDFIEEGEKLTQLHPLGKYDPKAKQFQVFNVLYHPEHHIVQFGFKVGDDACYSNMSIVDMKIDGEFKPELLVTEIKKRYGEQQDSWLIFNPLRNLPSSSILMSGADKLIGYIAEEKKKVEAAKTTYERISDSLSGFFRKKS